MKICLLNNLYPPYNRGSGAEIITQIIHKDLIKQGHDVIIITCKPYFSKLHNINQQKKVYYISSLYPSLNKIPTLLRFVWHAFHTIAWMKAIKIKKIIKNEKCELVISNNLEGLGFLIPKIINRINKENNKTKRKKINKNKKIKYIHILHDIQLLHPSGLMYYNEEKLIDSLHAKIYQKICKWCFNKIDLAIAPSTWLMQLHQKKGFFKNNKTLILKNPQIDKNKQEIKQEVKQEIKQEIKQEVKQEVKQENTYKEIQRSSNKPFTFISVGQIDYHKGIPILVKAFNNLIKQHNLNCQLIIIGSGSMLNKLKKESKNNLNKIKFLGKISNEEVHKNMQLADCLIVPSLCYENSPTIIFEALHNNLPVLASKIGGIPEILNNNSSLLFKANNLSELQTKMLLAVQRPDKLKQEFNKIKNNFKEINVSDYFKIINQKINIF